MTNTPVPLGRKLQGLLVAGPVAAAATLAMWVLLMVGGWTLFGPPLNPSPGLQQPVWRESLSVVIDLSVVFAYGVPIATVVTLALGLPLWWLAERRGWRGRHGAARLGAVAGAVVGLLPILFILQDALRTRDADSYSEFGRWGATMWVNGWPTALGWVFQLANSLSYVLVGIVAGLVALTVAMRPPRAAR